MSLFKSLCIAFSMYSKIPTPKAAWEEKNMKYVMCFFPLIGAVIGAVQLLWFFLCREIFPQGIPFLIGGAIAFAIPFLITGGIHMDGYLDTADALASMGDQKQKQRILKDTHVGAFAIIRGGIYMILSFAGWTTLMEKGITPFFLCVCIGYVMSRAFSGFSVVSFPLASRGLVSMFAEASQKTKVRITMILYLIAGAGAMVVIGGVKSMVILGAMGIHYGNYYKMTKEQFGGINGDTCGYYLQQAELLILFIGGVL